MLTVCVLFGGVSSEHEVSLRSATSVLRNLDSALFTPVVVGMTKKGRWLRYHGPIEAIESGEWENGEVTPCHISPDREDSGLLEFGPEGPVAVKVDVCFPVLHGKNGEDGTVQGLLALAGIPCVGCGVLASALCMDKAVSHTLLLAAGVPKTKLVALTRADTADFDALERRLAEEVHYPMFIKPANAGSSVGVSKVKDATALRDAISLAFHHDRKIVVEQMLTGREVECAVMGNESPIAAEVLGELEPSHEFYDYAGKYLDDSTLLHVPARLADEELARRVREVAVRAYQALGCAGFARVDFFVDETKPLHEAVVLNEINTIPGFTSISMYPRLFEASGVPYSELVTKLITYAAG